MLNLILILLGLISNPNSNTSNCGHDGTSTTASAPETYPNPGDTGGETGPTLPPKK